MSTNLNKDGLNFKRWILITGSTDGFGRQLAQELAANIYENFVIIHGRSEKNCQKTVEELGMEHENVGNNRKQRNVDFVAADFSKLSEVLKMSEVVRLRFPRLNTLIACASVVVQRRIKSHDGLELTLQINHLSHIVLFTELLPLLELNSPSRILTVGSMLHNFSSINWNDINSEGCKYDKFAQYSLTKLMNHLATLYLHRLMFKHKKQFQVTANIVDAEKRVENEGRTILPQYSNRAQFYSSLFPASSEPYLYEHVNALETLVRLTEDKEFEGISGKYFDANGKELKLGASVCDVRVQDQLWSESVGICEKILGITRRT
uniref:Uncharacterized protein n=2 Tax=Meloidogyne enterolobii TaxID=390850 RepID=A0A6V7WXH5_MELEN|nr:unnamed protein product [Meloidogyne enterolobii]